MATTEPPLTFLLGRTDKIFVGTADATPVRTVRFRRKSRIKRGYTVTVGYAFSFAV